jgi:hypothetical protein
LKKHLPPKSFIWRSRKEAAWNGRYADMPAKSCRDNAWGSEKRAILEVLRHCWDWFLVCNGHDAAKCPIKNLWDQSLFAIVDPGASLASSSAG